MCRELRPPEDAVLVDDLLVEKVVGLVGIAEGIEACGHHLLHARLYLLIGEGVALAEEVLVFTHTVDVFRFAVEIEAFVAVLAGQRPRDGAEAEWREQVVGGLAVALYHRVEIVEIGFLHRPAPHAADGLLLAHGLRLAGLQSQFVGQAQHLFAALLREFVDELEGGGLAAVVLYFSVHEDAVALLVGPYVYAEWFDAYLVGYLQHNRTVDAEGLRTLAEAPLRTASAAYPRHVGYAFGMVDAHFQ